ncbi:YbaB/EbfC family nucleoid-associated protein [Streptoalloteichus hindustanus]|uniref:YbaB/EbfC DNA-binding family protein n=1 Tax=Streptoalloteichus hindustanus TaxID=2017 RepID=A0A1M5ENZ0_STRHI|nr:YbaB/EbfC family nucleoid-associated protein [Streptoalloteichus hindustanus]SHF80810.1 YbaB/EbfC DNA-binding family protein [Streptoalloteichus hindustanus]
METQQWLTDFEATVADLRRKSQELEENIGAAATTVSSPDGSVTVTVAPNGGLQQLALGHRACELGPARLTALIMETVHKGQRMAAHKVAEAFAPLGAGTEAMGMLTSHLPELDEAEERELDAQQAARAAGAPVSPPAAAPAPPASAPVPPSPAAPPVRPAAPGPGSPQGPGFPQTTFEGQGGGAAGRARPHPQTKPQDDDDDDVDLW